MRDEEAAAPRPKRLFKKRWMTAGAVAVLAVGLWLAREPIADSFIRDQFDGRDIPARYTIDEIGFSTERLIDVVIGDPAKPDLTAKVVEVQMAYGLSGPYVSTIRADGVRLYGRFVDGQLSLGALDRFRDPTDTTPFALPDLAVALRDARARIDTPWGAVGAALNGTGNLRKDFTGKLAMVAPAVAASGCIARDVSFYGDVRVRDVRPQLEGPLRGRTLSCADGGVAAVSPQIALDLSLDETLRSWKGEADAAISRLTAGDMHADRVALLARFDGTAERTSLATEAKIARLRGRDFSAETVALDAKATIGRAAPIVSGTIRFARAGASSGLRRSLADAGKGLSQTPVGPLAAKAGAALAAMLADTGGGANFLLTGEGPAQRIEVSAANLTSASGARLSGGSESRVAYLFGADRPAWLIDGLWRFGGGGLPSGELTLDRSADGILDGTARFDSYAAADARLALDPVRFSTGKRGTIRFTTRAALSGPLGDGRVEGLSLPLSGAIAPSGGIALDGGCTRVGFERLSAAGFRFDRTGFDLCSHPGHALLSAGKDGLRGRIAIPRIALHGTSGTSPFAFESGRGAIDLATMRWALADADVRLGEGEGATHFAVAALSGQSAQGLAGELADARGKLGAVPLQMSEIAGDWRWVDGALTLDGGLVLTDASPDPRFAPLVSDNATLRFANGAIEATAGFDERRKGRKILDAVIRHDLGAGVGHADLIVDDLRFDDGFQPDQLTPLALGVVANVQGSVDGTGRIDWTPDGVTSRGRFTTTNTNLAAAFGPVTGLSGTLTFDDLLSLRSAPGQTATLAEVNPGIPVVDGKIEYRMLGDNRVRIEGGRWPFAGGELVLHPALLDFSAAQTRRLSFDIVGVDAAVFLQQFGFENINASGKFDGTLPVEFGGLGARIVGGRIDARQGGGTLAYVGELSNHNLGTVANFAFGALRSLKYDDLSILLSGDLDGEMVTDIRFGGVGQGEGATRNFLTRQVAKLPLVFNVKIHAPFRQLITSAKGSYDPTVLIEQNLPTLLRVQEQIDAAKAGDDAPVQPPESEPMP